MLTVIPPQIPVRHWGSRCDCYSFVKFWSMGTSSLVYYGRYNLNASRHPWGRCHQLPDNNFLLSREKKCFVCLHLDLRMDNRLNKVEMIYQGIDCQQLRQISVQL